MARKAKKVRAGRTKTALNAIYHTESGGYSARAVVDLFKAKHTDIISTEHDELLDMALMLLAGRVAAAPITDPDVRTLFGDDIPKRLTDIPLKVNGRVSSRKLPTEKVTPKVWLERHRASAKISSQHKHSDEIVDEIIAKMIAEGMPEDMTIEEYKRRGK